MRLTDQRRRAAAPDRNGAAAGSLWGVAAACLCALCILAWPAAGADASSLVRRVAGPLVDSRASNSAVQPQPAPGMCHAVGSGQYSRPDPRCTPGTLNPAVTQADIGQTICKSGWTSTVRPPERVTEQEKRLSLLAYGHHQPLGAYEYDHFVPLELGGATNDPRNLWPEPGATPNPKDAVEDYLNRQVCEHKMTLAAAQRAIVVNWITIYRQIGASAQPKPPTTAPSATCSASAQWSSAYNDYDVHVSSNQPDTKVTVSGAGTSASWTTDSSGNADVYFHAGRSAAGDPLTVAVGAATCRATL